MAKAVGEDEMETKNGNSSAQDDIWKENGSGKQAVSSIKVLIHEVVDMVRTAVAKKMGKEE